MRDMYGRHPAHSRAGSCYMCSALLRERTPWRGCQESRSGGVGFFGPASRLALQSVMSCAQHVWRVRRDANTHDIVLNLLRASMLGLRHAAHAHGARLRFGRSGSTWGDEAVLPRLWETPLECTLTTLTRPVRARAPHAARHS